MSGSKSRLSPKQRKEALQSYGFEPARDGRGSHATWEHPELKLLARTHKIEAPANLGSGHIHCPWEMTVAGDPADGTWNSMIKQAKWCQETVQSIKSGSDHDRQRCEVANQFRAAAARPPKAGKRKREFQNSGIHSPSPM